MQTRETIEPQQIREVKISKNPWKRRIKIIILLLLVAIIGVGVWIGYSANVAIKKITDDSGSKAGLFSFLGEFDSSNIKGKEQGRTNVLILGMGGSNHPGGMLSDTMIVLSINYSDKRLGMISVPRDLWVPIPSYGHAKINEAYYRGEANKKTTGGGGVLASRTVENVLGIPIHYYIRMDFEGFKKIIDTLGGIDVYVEKDIYDPFYPAADMIRYDPFRISAGTHHMNGDLALKYARSRETTSDFDRSRRQMQILAAVREKVLTVGTLGNPKKITDLINVLGEHLRTNMEVSEIRALWEEAKNLDMTNIVNKVLDTSPGGLLVASQDYRGYYVYPKKGLDNFADLQKMAKNIFQGEESDISQIKIQVSNATGRSGLAATVAQYLETYGFTVVKKDNFPSNEKYTVVYDYSGGKYKSDAQKIADLLKAKVQTGSTVRTDVNIQIVVGQDYLSNQ